MVSPAIHSLGLAVQPPIAEAYSMSDSSIPLDGETPIASRVALQEAVDKALAIPPSVTQPPKGTRVRTDNMRMQDALANPSKSLKDVDSRQCRANLTTLQTERSTIVMLRLISEFDCIRADASIEYAMLDQSFGWSAMLAMLYASIDDDIGIPRLGIPHTSEQVDTKTITAARERVGAELFGFARLLLTHPRHLVGASLVTYLEGRVLRTEDQDSLPMHAEATKCIIDSCNTRIASMLESIQPDGRMHDLSPWERFTIGASMHTSKEYFARSTGNDRWTMWVRTHLKQRRYRKRKDPNYESKKTVKRRERDERIESEGGVCFGTGSVDYFDWDPDSDDEEAMAQMGASEDPPSAKALKVAAPSERPPISFLMTKTSGRMWGGGGRGGGGRGSHIYV